MNLVGKIFVVCIFVMSMVFASFAIMVYATHTNWRDEIYRTAPVGNKGIGWKERYKQKEEELANLTNERNELEVKATADKLAHSQALSKSEAEVQSLSNELNSANAERAQKAAELTSSNNALKQAQDNLSNAVAEVQKLRDENVTLQKETDAQIKRSIELTDGLAKANGDRSVLKERNEQLTLDVDNATRLLKGLGMSIKDPSDASKIPVVGIITAVSHSKVELSIGVDDGVRIGQELDIYRGDKYVGRVKVVEARPDNAVATVLGEYQQFPIQRGDNVGSELSSKIKPNG
jgi:hypothetical protein